MGMPMQCNCLDGWKGPHCDEPVCHANCVPPFGKCQAPNKCVCETGYSGANCDKCQTYPGCQNGTCYVSEYGSFVPWSCKCDPGWMGMLCVQKRDPNSPFQVSNNEVQGTLGLNDLKPRYQWPWGSFRNFGQNGQPMPRAGASASRLTDQLRNMGKIDRMVG